MEEDNCFSLTHDLSNQESLHRDRMCGFNDNILPHTKQTFYCRYVKSIINQYGINLDDVYELFKDIQEVI